MKRSRSKPRRLKSCRCHGCDRYFDCAEAFVVESSPCCGKPALVCAECAWIAMTEFQHSDGVGIPAPESFGVLQ